MVSSPEKKCFQNIGDISTIMEQKDAEILHYLVAKLLWVSKGERPDIETYILFLCIRVTNITKEENAKLRLVLKYLKHTIYDKRIMGSYSLI